MPTIGRASERIVGDVAKAGAAPEAGGGVVGGGGSIFTEPVLIVNQKAKLIEINNEYAVYDRAGRQMVRCARSARARSRR